MKKLNQRRAGLRCEKNLRQISLGQRRQSARPKASGKVNVKRTENTPGCGCYRARGDISLNSLKLNTARCSFHCSSFNYNIARVPKNTLPESALPSGSLSEQ